MLGWIPVVGSLVAKASWVDWAVLAGGAGAILYWLSTWTHDHFRRRGMPYARPWPLFGNMASVAFGLQSVREFTIDYYKKFDGCKAFGIFEFMTPVLFIRDLDLIKLIAIKEFDHFTNRQPFGSEKVEPLFGRSIFSLKGKDWRGMRNTLSPAFTSSKMRNIFNLIDLCGIKMAEFLKRKFETTTVYETDMKEFFGRFANNVIATSAFGVEVDSLKHPKNEFFSMGREMTHLEGIKRLIGLAYVFLPKVIEGLRIPINRKEVRNFFHNLVHDTIKERQEKGIFRPDMLQLLMQAREGQLKAEAGDEQESISGAKLKTLSDVDMTAQATVFFFAGLDSIASPLSFSAYALARHPEVQQRLQREVDETFEKNGGKLTYEAVQEAKYMDMFVSEILRQNSASTLSRVCTKDFTIPPQGNVPAYTVRKGESIRIAMTPVQMDPKYWDDPEKFDPERFSEENKHKIKPFTYIPFGVGPRRCIAARFALMELKVALSHILRHFSFQATAKTPKKVEFAPFDFRNIMKGGCWVGITPRPQ